MEEGEQPLCAFGSLDECEERDNGGSGEECVGDVVAVSRLSHEVECEDGVENEYGESGLFAVHECGGLREVRENGVREREECEED